MNTAHRSRTRTTRRAIASLLLAGAVTACGQAADDTEAVSAEPVNWGWTIETSEPLGEKLGAVVFGDFDPEVAGDEVAVAGESGRVWLLVPRAEGWEVEQIAQAPGEMIQIAAGDIDALPGDELVLVGMAEGGEESGGRGAVNVLARIEGAWTLIPVGEAGSLVHGVALADVDPAPGPEILTAGFDREVVLYRRDAEGGFEARVLAQLPGAGKNVALHDEGVIVACNDGSLVSVQRDEEGAWNSSVAYTHPAGLARLFSDGERILAAADDGALVLVSDGVGTVLHSEPRKLRGAVLANLDATSLGLEAATVGYAGELSVLRATPEGGWTTELVFRDGDRLHHLAVGLPSSRSEGLALATVGYGGRVTVLWREDLSAER